MKIVLVSYTQYPDDKGGVPLYNYYLQRIFPDSKWYCWADFPHKHDLQNLSEEAKARILNCWLADTRKILRGDIIIGDGVWGAFGLNYRTYTLISVCHGLWRCSHGPCNIADIQKVCYSQSKLVVACSYSAKEECELYYRVNSKVVLTGVDLEFWKPLKLERYKIPNVLWVKKWKEYPGLREDCIQVLPQFNHSVIDSYDDDLVRKLYNRAKVFVHITSNEGNAFAILKSLACGTPVISNSTGLFYHGIPECGTVRAPKVREVVDGIVNVVNNGQAFSPRRWMKKHASLTKFGIGWKELVSKL